MNTLILQSIFRTLFASYAADLIAPEDYEVIVQAVSTLLVCAWGAYNAYRNKKKEQALKVQVLEAQNP